MANGRFPVVFTLINPIPRTGAAIPPSAEADGPLAEFLWRASARDRLDASGTGAYLVSPSKQARLCGLGSIS
jgi:hypothetical protein